MTPKTLIYSALAVLMCASLMCSVAYTAGHADAPIAASADEIQPLEVGDSAPRFLLQTVDGDNFDFDPAELQRPVVLASFRGGWCPYCNVYLSEMRHVLPQIRDLGVDVLFLSGDRAELLYDSLSEQAQQDIAGLDYTILSDANAQGAMALGIAFRSSMATKAWLTTKGKDYAGSSIDQHGVLPVPAVFAIGTDGRIEFAFTNADYKVRLPADELLAVAQKIAAE